MSLCTKDCIQSKYLLNHTELDYLPVVEDGRVQGIIWRRQLMDLLAHRFGRDLHQRKPISKVMDKKPIVVDAGTPLVELSRIVTGQEDRRRNDVFIVTEHKKYLGCGSFIDLLRVMTDLKVESAQHANPLSGLPGNVPIQKTIQGYLEQKAEFAVIYIDMDHFKPYNDYYSFEKGDEIIRNMSAILGRHVKEGKDFIGHIGGDDFIIITPRLKRIESICEGVIADFNEVAAAYYFDEDCERGGIVAKDRDGQERLFPLMSLSLGALLVYPDVFSHQQMVTFYATKAKKKAKAQGGNSFAVIDSRQMVQDAAAR